VSERRPGRLDAEGLWESALRALAKRAHSTGELREKLLGRAQRASDVPGVLARLKQSGYLNDQRFAEGYSASRLENQGFGKSRVLRDLGRRRVAPGLAEKAVQEAYRGVDEIELIEDFLRRKFRNLPLETHLAEPRKLASAYRRLRGAGFSAGNTLGVLKRYAREPELLDEMEGEEDRGL